MRVRTSRGSGQIGYRPTRRRHAFGHPHPQGNPVRTFAIWVLAALAATACIVFPPPARAATISKPAAPVAHGALANTPAPAAAPPAPRYGLVMQDALPLRSGARSGGTPLATLTQGELLEVRGERMDYLQVWDLARERGGYVRAGAVRTLALTPDEAPELLALVRFLRDRSGSESLGLGVAAAYLKAAPAGTITAEAFDAMGTMARQRGRHQRRQRADAAGRAEHRRATRGGRGAGHPLREPGARRPRLALLRRRRVPPRGRARAHA
jgi:hypothetical protein